MITSGGAVNNASGSIENIKYTIFEENHSKYIPLIINEIAHLKGIEHKTIEDKTTENFEFLFRVKHS